MFTIRYSYRHWSVSFWRDPDDVPHCRILSPDKTEWWFISVTLCGWRRCFVADQLWLMTCIREEEDWLLQTSMFLAVFLLLLINYNTTVAHIWCPTITIDFVHYICIICLPSCMVNKYYYYICCIFEIGYNYVTIYDTWNDLQRSLKIVGSVAFLRSLALSTRHWRSKL